MPCAGFCPPEMIVLMAELTSEEIVELEPTEPTSTGLATLPEGCNVVPRAELDCVYRLAELLETAGEGAQIVPRQP